MTATRLLLHRGVLLALYATCAWGHGYMFEPKSRNFLYNSDYCPQCLNAGGPGVVSGGANFPQGRWGICGDPWNGVRKHEEGGVYARGEFVATYQEGQVVQVSLLISAFHKGRAEFRICKINGLDEGSERAQLTETCLSANQLVQANVAGAQSPGDKYYHFGQIDNNNFCQPGACLVQGTIHQAWFKLPVGLTCDGVTSKCVMQWHWLTGNSCEPPGEGAPWTPHYMSDCGTPGGPYPEEFWNCADIKILPSGTPLPPDPTPQSSPSPPQNPSASPIPPSPSPPLPIGPSGCASGDAACYCKFVGKDGFYPDTATGCKKFYMCSQGLAFYQKCPVDPLIFNPTTMACDYPQYVTCPSTPTPTPSPTPTPNPNPSSSTATCGAKNAKCFCTGRPVGTYPAVKTKCKGFFQCAPGAAQYVPCTSGTLYSMATNQCEWASGVLCPAVGSSLKTQAIQPKLKIIKGAVIPHTLSRPWKTNRQAK